MLAWANSATDGAVALIVIAIDATFIYLFDWKWPCRYIVEDSNGVITRWNFDQDKTYPNMINLTKK